MPSPKFYTMGQCSKIRANLKLAVGQLARTGDLMGLWLMGLPGLRVSEVLGC